MFRRINNAKHAATQAARDQVRHRTQGVFDGLDVLAHRLALGRLQNDVEIARFERYADLTRQGVSLSRADRAALAAGLDAASKWRIGRALAIYTLLAVHPMTPLLAAAVVVYWLWVLAAWLAHLL